MIIIKKIFVIFVLVFYLVCPISAENEDVYLLARAAEAVAGDESYTVMLSVSSVIVNRLQSEAYPSSLGAVISDAGIDISDSKPSPRAVRAARDAVHGFDPTGGALRFSYGGNDGKPILLGVDSWCFY